MLISFDSFSIFWYNRRRESRIKLPDGRFELTFGSVNPVKKVRFGMG